jgi:hypothetical protein
VSAWRRWGATTEGRPFLLVTISSEANMGRLESIRAQNLRLADPRGLGEAEGERLVETGKTIVALNHGIHSDEVASPLTAMETAYALAAGDDPATREVLDGTVILMVPSQNPDGVDKVTRWYREHLGTPFEAPGCESDCRLPFLYHHYTGHDDNRDWYAFTQAETRLTVQHLYDRWASPDRRGPARDVRARRAPLRAPLPRPLGPQRGPRAARGLERARDAHRSAPGRGGPEGAWSSTRSTTPGALRAPIRTRTAACAS